MNGNEEPIGFMINGDTVLCPGCALDPSQQHVPVYRANIFPYAQHCANCWAPLVEPQTPAWPELFDKRV